MNIAYFGTSDRSIPFLKELNNNFKLVLTVTKKDTIVGRNKELRETEVKKWSKKNNIKLLEIDNFKGENLRTVIEQINNSKVDYILVADFSFIIPEEFLEIFKNRVINAHFSILPKYRGASPVQFSIINGDSATGVTFYLVNKFMDRGDILEQFEYIIPSNVTSGELYSLLFEFASKKIIETLNKYSNNLIVPTKQNESEATYTYSKTNPKATYIYKEDAKIDWDEDLTLIERKIRAFNPWPISWTTALEFEQNLNKIDLDLNASKTKNLKLNKDLKIKIYKALISNNKLKILEIQVEGSKKISWNDFRNGYLN